MDYKTIANDGIVEEEIKKSRFICHLKRISSEEEGREYIAQIKKQHHKANHSCSAIIVGDDGQIKRSSDDGEPSGTAGVPMLTVLEKQGLTNIVAVVTRYFGGIKLGAGGLIRAYSGSVAHAIEEIGRVEVKELTGLTVELTYSQYQVFSNFLEKEGLQEFDTTFLSDVSTTLFVEESDIERLGQELTEFYQGKVNYEKSGKYTPATHDHKALNVPKPLKPEYINEYSHDGICAFLAYWIESTNYAYLTGDLKPLSQITDPYKIIHPEILKMYEDNTGWVIGPQHIYTLELVTPASGNDFKDSTIYEWQSVLRVSPEATVYVTANKSEKLFTDFIGAREKADISSDVRYTDGEWHLVNDDGSNSYKKPL